MKNNKEIIKTSKEVKQKSKFSFKTLFAKIGSFFKSDKIKNEALFKRGGYSIVITALVLAALIAINWGFGALSERVSFLKPIDMTQNKKNSISEKNIDYLKNLKGEVEITVCGQEDAEYMYSMAEGYGIMVQSQADAEYFAQTVKLLRLYESYNENIKVKYVDINSTEFAEIRQRFPQYNEENGYFYAGDIIVSSKSSGQERSRYLSVLEDIYSLEEQSGAMYGYSGNFYTFSGGSILESSLTSAIDYVTSTQVKKAVLITGHSDNKYYEAYEELLKLNNYEITKLEAGTFNNIPAENDIAIICAPTRDFMKEELDAISKFLENDNKLGKGLIYFADPTCPQLTNLNSFLKQWGIEVQNGMIFETNDTYHLSGDPTKLFMLPYIPADSQISTYQDLKQSIDGIYKNIDILSGLAGYVIPMKAGKSASAEITAKPLMQTYPSSVLAPIGSPITWEGYKESDKQQYDGIIEAKKSRYDNTIEDVSKREISSYIMAFSSVEFVASQYATSSSYDDQCSNQAIVMAVTDRAAHKSSTHTFESKVISYDSFYADVTEKDTKTIGIIFIGVVPIAVITTGIVIFIRRRKAI